MDILDTYVKTAPDPQSVIDIFADEWSSKMPENSGLISKPGSAALFSDARITWLSDQIGGFEGKNILEMGPLEAGHTYMLCKGGAKAVTAIESNSRSYLKCLCIKELFALDQAKFLYGDALAYAHKSTERFDLCVASGILYHMIQPIEFLQKLTERSNTMFVWTHYFDEEALKKNNLSRQFEAPSEISVGGKKYCVAKRNYMEALGWAGFCGGGNTWANWLTRDSLFRAVEDCGFAVSSVGFDHAGHPNGPSLAFIAKRS